jgi:hypothetical protein
VVSASPLSLHEVARVGPAALRSGRLLTPHVVREERSVVRAQAWGRRPATRGRGSVGPAGTPPPADGTLPPRSRQGMRWEKCIETPKNIIVVYMSYTSRFRPPLHDAFCATDTPGDCPSGPTPPARGHPPPCTGVRARSLPARAAPVTPSARGLCFPTRIFRCHRKT